MHRTGHKMGEDSGGINVTFGPQGLLIDGVDVELPQFIASRLGALHLKRNIAQAQFNAVQAILESYVQGVCDGLGVTADGSGAVINIDTMTYRRKPKE